MAIKYHNACQTVSFVWKIMLLWTSLSGKIVSFLCWDSGKIVSILRYCLEIWLSKVCTNPAWGKPFFCLCHLLRFPPSSTKNRRLFSMISICSVWWVSFVIYKILHNRRLWLTVSYAAERSTKTTPITILFLKPSSMFCVRLVTWLVVDFPGQNPARSGIRYSGIFGVTLLRIRR